MPDFVYFWWVLSKILFYICWYTCPGFRFSFGQVFGVTSKARGGPQLCQKLCPCLVLHFAGHFTTTAPGQQCHVNHSFSKGYSIRKYFFTCLGSDARVINYY